MSTCSLILIENPLQPETTRRAIPCHPGQWLSEVAPIDGDWVAVDGGRVLPRSEWDTVLLVPGSDILLYPRLTDNPMQLVTGIIFPPLLIAYGAGVFGAPAWAQNLSMAAFGGGLGTALGVQRTIESIMAPTFSPLVATNGSSSGDLDSSPTYGFSGIEVA